MCGTKGKGRERDVLEDDFGDVGRAGDEEVGEDEVGEELESGCDI